jgi:hypothetical protein
LRQLEKATGLCGSVPRNKSQRKRSSRIILIFGCGKAFRKRRARRAELFDEEQQLPTTTQFFFGWDRCFEHGNYFRGQGAAALLGAFLEGLEKVIGKVVDM